MEISSYLCINSDFQSTLFIASLSHPGLVILLNIYSWNWNLVYPLWNVCTEVNFVASSNVIYPPQYKASIMFKFVYSNNIRGRYIHISIYICIDKYNVRPLVNTNTDKMNENNIKLDNMSRFCWDKMWLTLSTVSGQQSILWYWCGSTHFSLSDHNPKLRIFRQHIYIKVDHQKLAFKIFYLRITRPIGLIDAIELALLV